MYTPYRAITFIIFLTVFSVVAQFTNPPLASAERRAARFPEAKCKEFAKSVFKPCICPSKVPATIQFRPSLKECKGKAAAILSGNVAKSYSVVLRDKQNRDRWPASGYHSCSAAETELGLNKCSAFKCQKVLRVSSSSVKEGSQQICCFGEAGTSPIMKGATRMTIKLRDIPDSNQDPLIRVCLNNFSVKQDLN